MAKLLNLKVAEAIQDDVNKGIVRIDSKLMGEIGVKSGDIVEISGERSTVGIADRAYPGDIGLNVIRMDGVLRRNAKTGISEIVKVKKIEIAEAKRLVIAPARQGIRITAPPNTFRQSLLGRALVKGDVVSLGGARRRYRTMSGHPLFDELFTSLEDTMVGFPFGDLKFVVVETNPKKAVIVTDLTEVVLSPQAVQIKEETMPEIAYEDIGGLNDEIKKIREMVELPLKHPEIFERLGIEPPKGILLYGPPGTGKTLLAKAVANETNAHFILINGPEVMSKFYGQSEENIRKKFEDAEKNAPAIIFIDEIDAIAIKREESRGEVERRVVAQLLALMDGLKSRGKVIVIAATNLPDQIDQALRRPGRFDREVEIGVPDKEGRLNILKIHTRNMPILGSLYSDLLLAIIVDKIKEKEIEVKEKIKKDTEQIDTLKKSIKLGEIAILSKKEEINIIKSKMEELEEQKKKADQTLLYKITESIKLLAKGFSLASSEIKKIEDQIVEENNKIKSMLEDVSLAEVNITRLKKLWNDEKSKSLNIIEDIKSLEEARRFYSPTDPRLMIIKTKFAESEHYKLLDLYNLYGVSIEDARREGAKEDLKEIASVTHGFVGADVAALAKETAMIVLRKVLPDLKLNEEAEIPKEILEKLKIIKEDFMEALKVVHPSAMREVLVEIPNITWDDIGGHEDVKQELKEAVEWPLKHAEAFQRLGIRPPRGVLLYGPPGTGKTLLAKAVANESDANFILVKGPELLSQWVGESEKAVRNVFKRARQTSPTIIFFDEIDALAPMRGLGGDSHVTERVVNQLLTEMDGLEELQDVIVVAATNRPDILDTALLRPGRFDRIILTKVPDEDMRTKIFSVHLKKMPLAKDVSIGVLAKKTINYVGADIEAVCREAAILSLRKDMEAKEVPMSSFEEALNKVKPSVTADIEKAYEDLEDKFKAARAKQMALERPSYFG